MKSFVQKINLKKKISNFVAWIKSVQTKAPKHRTDNGVRCTFA